MLRNKNPRITHGTPGEWGGALNMSDKTIKIEIAGIHYGNMIYVSGGTFKMGSDHFDWSMPIHDVTVDDFYICEIQVTQELWMAVMGSNPSESKYGVGIGGKLPVNNVSWNEVVDVFLPALNRLTGLKFRLPTEAEWEFAARGGNKSRGYKYSGSNKLDNVAWYWKNSDNGTNPLHSVHPVAAKLPNELGIYDMSGNVCEWCQDFFEPSYPSEHLVNPTGPSSGNQRVFRGGSWQNQPVNLRVGHRCANPPDYRAAFIGVRVAI